MKLSNTTLTWILFLVFLTTFHNPTKAVAQGHKQRQRMLNGVPQLQKPGRWPIRFEIRSWNYNTPIDFTIHNYTPNKISVTVQNKEVKIKSGRKSIIKKVKGYGRCKGCRANPRLKIRAIAVSSFKIKVTDSSERELESIRSYRRHRYSYVPVRGVIKVYLKNDKLVIE